MEGLIMKKRTREEYRALTNEWCNITKNIETAIDNLSKKIALCYSNKDFDKLGMIYDDIITINDQFMYGKDPNPNVKFKSNGDIEEMLNKIYMLIYEFYPFFDFEWITILLENELDTIIALKETIKDPTINSIKSGDQNVLEKS